MTDTKHLFLNYDNYLFEYPSLDSGSVKAFEYTRKAIRRMDQVLSSIEFEQRDTECIYSYLTEEIDLIPFSSYLKRYIYKKAALETPYSEVADGEYQAIIKDSFLENRTPFAWQPTSKKPGSIIRGWLKRKKAMRQTVFLLGFGLRMSDKDVSDFLVKAIKETDFNFYDPEEALCWHCFHCGKNHPEYLALKKEIQAFRGDSAGRVRYWETVAQNPEAYLFDEEKLMGYLFYLNSREKEDQSVAAAEFGRLYEAAGALCDEGMEDLPSRIEHKFLSGIPKDTNDNLRRIKDSVFADIFMHNKMSRQRIDAILKGKQMVNRFDIISMLFFIYSQKDMSPDERRDEFIFETNHILIRCRMSCLLFSNPYEAFVIMCLMTDDPLEAYSEVWEMSYTQSDK